MTRRRVWRPALVGGALSLLVAGPAAAAVPASELATARLEGFWVVRGRVTKVLNVPGEKVGERVRRTWAFVPSCPAGACSVTLIRRRSRGTDHVFLHPLGPGLYQGGADFYAPVRCAGRTHARGELVPFTITLRITAVAPQPDGSVLATGFRATYRNPSRTGLTRCYSPASHDSATYVGVPAPSAASSGSIRRVRSVASSTGS